jgi:hypothetical protein
MKRNASAPSKLPYLNLYHLQDGSNDGRNAARSQDVWKVALYDVKRRSRWTMGQGVDEAAAFLLDLAAALAEVASLGNSIRPLLGRAEYY